MAACATPPAGPRHCATRSCACCTDRTRIRTTGPHSSRSETSGRCGNERERRGAARCGSRRAAPPSRPMRYACGVRALIYDRTCVWHGGALSHAWAAGSRLYRARGRIDAALGVASWDQALRWLAELQAPIDEVQYWGHGKWGCALVDRDVLDEAAL